MTCEVAPHHSRCGDSLEARARRQDPADDPPCAARRIAKRCAGIADAASSDCDGPRPITTTRRRWVRPRRSDSGAGDLYLICSTVRPSGLIGLTRCWTAVDQPALILNVAAGLDCRRGRSPSHGSRPTSRGHRPSEVTPRARNTPFAAGGSEVVSRPHVAGGRFVNDAPPARQFGEEPAGRGYEVPRRDRNGPIRFASTLRRSADRGLADLRSGAGVGAPCKRAAIHRAPGAVMGPSRRLHPPST